MRCNHRGGAQTGILFGVVLIIVGCFLLAQKMGFISFNILTHFWPLMPAIIGLRLLTSNGGSMARAWGLVFLGASVLMELQKFGIIRVRFWDLWPLWIIALGFFLLFRAIWPPDPVKAQTSLSSSRISEFAIFGGGEITVSSQSFQGGNLTAVFGGQEVDCRTARINGDGVAVIYADAVFGGVSLKVPPTWFVTIESSAVFGGVESKALTPADSDTPKQHLIIKGLALFGGVEVKN